MVTIGIDPVIVHIGSFAIRWYSLMIMLAALTGVLWTWKATQKAGIPGDYAFTVAIWTIPGGIVGSRLTHILDQFSYYAANPAAMIGGEGEAITGAVLGGVLAVWIGSKVHKYPFGKLIDLAAPGLILAQFIGRIGCTINGDAYGVPTSGPLAIIYTNPNSFAPLGVPTLPSVWFEMAWDLVVFAALMIFRGRLKPDGSLFMVYLAMYNFGRFFIDFTRSNQPWLFGLHQAQIITLLVLIVVVPMLIARVRWQRSQNVSDAGQAAAKP